MKKIAETFASKPITRRAALKAGGIAGTALAAPWIIAAKSSDTLIVNSLGGEYQAIIEEHVLNPFAKKFGVEVIHDPTGSASQDYAKIRASQGAPGFDVAEALTPPEVILGANEGLLEPVSEREVPNIKHLWSQSGQIVPPYGIAHTVQFAALVYNKDKIEAPTSWAHYWEAPKRYGPEISGHIINYNPANLLSVYALIHAAQLGGGGIDNMEPAWDLLKALKPHIGVVVTGSSEAVPHFENGEVWVSPYWSARAGYYIERGLPFGSVLPEEGVIGLYNVAAIPAGSENKKLAFEFLNFRLDKEVQYNFSLAYQSSPGRGDIADWPAEFAKSQIVRQEQMDRMQFPDSAVIGEKRKEWTLRWQEIMA